MAKTMDKYNEAPQELQAESGLTSAGHREEVNNPDRSRHVVVG